MRFLTLAVVLLAVWRACAAHAADDPLVALWESRTGGGAVVASLSTDAAGVDSLRYSVPDTPNSIPTGKPQGLWAGNPTKFFAGAFAALLAHESGHLIANYAVGSSPYLKPVNYGPIPFFTIEPGTYLTPREHYLTASAGFNAQHLVNEWVLTSHPNLRKENEPHLKGVVTFNFWLTMGYAATAFAGSGPPERDTKGMADALGWNERWVGAMILVPTVLDKYRYDHPDAKWAKVASRISKLAIGSLVFTIDD